MSNAQKTAKNSAQTKPKPDLSLSPEQEKKLLNAIEKFYAQATRLNQEYVPVALELILLHKIPDVTLFLASTDDKNAPHFKVFREEGLYMSQVEIDTLEQNGIKNVYIQRSDVAKFTQYVEGLLQDLQEVSEIIDTKKIELLRGSAIKVMTDIFAAPTPENIDRGIKVVSGFVYTLTRDPKAYQILLSLSSHDHYTFQHSVGVATNSIIIAKKMGIENEKDLIEVGVGALLHDIGKTKVSPEIINKKGPLDEAEWAIMKQHSLFGYEILKDNPHIGMRAKLAVLQHHEDANGTGYPMGLSSNQVDLYAKIVTLADIYNAITTDRTYSKAKPPFEAFALIKDKMSHKVDMKIFESLVLIYGGKP